MRDLFDRRLTDPTAVEVADALRAAVAAVNANRRVGNLPAIDANVGAVAERVVREPSGHSLGFGVSDGRRCKIGRLALAWWANPAGRKLVRVRGWREPDRRFDTRNEFAEHEYEGDLKARPAVWHLDHERVVETFTAGDPEWVAVCGCGAAGSAESLGWHHGMCGPCADRVAEYGPGAVEHAPALLVGYVLPGDPAFVPRGVAFTADGQLVVASGDGAYCAWEAPTGAPHCPPTHDPELAGEARPAAAPDRPVVALARSECVLLLDFAEGTAERLVPAGGNVRAAHWTGRPNELLIQNDTGSLSLADATDGRLRPVAPPPVPGAKLYAVWPDAAAPRAVFADGHRAAVVRVGADGGLTEESRFLLGDGRLNRTGLWEDGPEVVRFTPDGERLLFARGTEMELRLPARPKALQQVEFAQPVRDACFSPDYERVYVLTADGVIRVCNPGMLAGERARLRWHTAPAARLAIAPDGRTLATAGPEGVKLWPVAGLLALLE